MRVVGVLDLLGGRVVRGVGGRRHEYRPVGSRLTKSCRPVDVARAFRDHLGLEELYLADLDAIAGAEPAWDVLAALHSHGFRTWVDAGVRRPARAVELSERGVEFVVAGLETLEAPAALPECVRPLRERLIFSLDLRDGVPLGDPALWGSTDPVRLAGWAVARGVRHVLVLDLARVGSGAGPSEALCARLATDHPGVEVSTGGGVRGRADLERLRGLGVRAVLLASALHYGALTRADLAGL
jgi:phosphoribosylformimino-5-aminoimidazole carboxamide ribotide isomerase